MPLKSIDPTTTSAWKKLTEHFHQIKDEKILDWFQKDDKRAEKFQIEWRDFFLDFSKNKISSKTLELLLSLAEEVDLNDAIEKHFNGDIINETEHRAVLHTDLRKKNKPEEVQQALAQMKNFSEKVIEGKWKGATGKKIETIVNVGVGGSDLGPKMVTNTLKFYKNHLETHFVSNMDGDQVAEILKHINPETALVIVVSKSFGTQETITNSNTIKKWFQNHNITDFSKHFVAVSANQEKAQEFGIDYKNIFPMWDWVGGRFSLWSPVGLTISCAIGFQNFEELLLGAREMDDHFQKTDFAENIPVILALLSIWYNNFFKAETEAIIPYSHYLQEFVPYLQQGIMESNGKSVSRKGNPINYQTGTIIWGQPGSNCQHAFFQLFHQGTKIIPTDFIGFKKPLNKNKKQHDKLMANFFAQTEALLKGKSKEEIAEELKYIDTEQAKKISPFKEVEGNKPTNTILIEKLTPKSLGSLISMYEHKIFIQGVIWNIFSYDQWGVELGKQLASKILPQIKNQKIERNQDSSTSSLLKRYFS
ncbi:glucose-6-phosphate isomerase [Mesonia maritima]|uniref:Glucose-6-phosphate isomerase n=1 Tax=Mesonia maritima TaxID=1793873 RepID=A0ABU1K663_9FLAO|nr:glucose-6-phosphate isomerase [Mesonia maritima]MDR6301103.1 glucose-6-phosphate isomerase [Mesonia maritima]